jgi:cytochrome c oxidase accessory protein FixG
MCPYARFQSAMFDKDTLIVSYDPGRGEPRGSRSKKADARSEGLGDCIDCTLCVQVCPTGIDIREGLQYECISCAACIDVCDGVMDKMNYPRGLIRFDTQNGLTGHLGWAKKLRRVLRPRVLIYGSVLLLISGGLLFSLLTRSPVRLDIVRDRSVLARQVEDGYIENLYRLQLMNTTESAQRYGVAVEGLDGIALARPVDVSLAPAEARWVALAVRVPPATAARAGGGAHVIHFRLEPLGAAGAAAGLSEKSTFVVPR